MDRYRHIEPDPVEKDDMQEKIESFNKKTFHYLCTIFFSMLTAILTTLAIIGKF